MKKKKIPPQKCSFIFFSAYFVKVFADIVCHVDTINYQSQTLTIQFQNLFTITMQLTKINEDGD